MPTRKVLDDLEKITRSKITRRSLTVNLFVEHLNSGRLTQFVGSVKSGQSDGSVETVNL